MNIHNHSFLLFLLLLVNLTFINAQNTQELDVSTFQYNKEGFYYKYHILNNVAPLPLEGDVVDITLTIYTSDSTIVPTFPTRDQITESLFKGDFYAALRMLHLGDSATFILNGDSIFQYFFGEEYPYGTQPLFFDIKLDKITLKADFEVQKEQKRIEYEALLAEYKLAEDSLLTDYLNKNKIKTKPTKSGLYYVKTKSGRGEKVKISSKVKVHYKGLLIDGTEFDNSFQRGEPIEIEAGVGQVIPGFDEALLLMKQGGKATLIIHSKLAYGEKGAGTVIPPYSTIIFEIELISVE
ncbi:MAG: hypothetical protein CVU04_04470 [Bacteroidetes bacterium HGW-Bacteroidetes-20]|nr:MAG: hypothetical protein CVU04_04470 [Bacteroidetes bacterium HGW-Bacteroidetes-20]